MLKRKSIGTVELATRVGYSARQIQRRAESIPGWWRSKGGHYRFRENDDLTNWIGLHTVAFSEIGRRGRKRRAPLRFSDTSVLDGQKIGRFVRIVAGEAMKVIAAANRALDRAIEQGTRLARPGAILTVLDVEALSQGDGGLQGRIKLARQAKRIDRKSAASLLDAYAMAGLIETPQDRANWKVILGITGIK